MARVAPEDPYEQLADPSLLVVSPRDLDLFDSTEIDTERLTQDALATEEAALAVKGVSNSGGAGASRSLGGLVLVTSTGFRGTMRLHDLAGRSLPLLARARKWSAITISVRGCIFPIWIHLAK